ncbi:ribosome silencing factor [Halomonas sp. TBZ9]|uniref:Ribosomal silencing factor RsfS n=1 Tax=Vreelandella azerica TaxID=2732867 RepID=A0A7Y3TYR9_9GAMM|nr:ribosome silencing factor [Halomonas azerica]NOG32215.1 ribosome silencing factor [Halomonas azerica]
MQIETLKTLAVDALEELKARDITHLDVAKLTDVTDLMIIASGTSTRHVSALAQNLVEKAKEQGLQPRGVEGGANADWVLVDLGDVVVHVMLPEARALYDLERLWADLPADSALAHDMLRERMDGQVTDL